MVKRAYFLLAILIFLYTHGFAKPLSWVEKNPVIVGESFVLFIEVEGKANQVEPDLSNIRGIQILNRSVQNKTSIVGTHMKSKIKWSYDLIAFEEGIIIIPPSLTHATIIHTSINTRCVILTTTS